MPLLAAVLFFVITGYAFAQDGPERVDFNADGTVGFGDFVLFAGRFESTHPTYDLNGDGVVEFGDFIEFTGHFDAEVPPVSDLEILEGAIDQDRVLTANRTYLLRGAVFVEDGTTLIVMPGTTIQGESASTARLVISQGGLLIADGLATAPIVMTSDAPEGQRARAHQFR